ncbi:MAG: hypothetical protein IIC91_11460 [Chloroflexi bacterium]|nr:hypothetical protein [Chloroflexota bacterium]
MQIGKRTILRAGLGLAAVAAVLALVLMMGMFGSTEHTSAQEGETSGFTIPLSFYRLGEAGTVMNWSSEQVTDLLQGVEGVGGVNFIWITSASTSRGPRKGRSRISMTR